jgi:hypothetical protein
MGDYGSERQGNQFYGRDRRSEASRCSRPDRKHLSEQTANEYLVVSTKCGKLLETGAKAGFDRSLASQPARVPKRRHSDAPGRVSPTSLASIDPCRDPSLSYDSARKVYALSIVMAVKA